MGEGGDGPTVREAYRVRVLPTCPLWAPWCTVAMALQGPTSLRQVSSPSMGVAP